MCLHMCLLVCIDLLSWHRWRSRIRFYSFIYLFILEGLPTSWQPALIRGVPSCACLPVLVALPRVENACRPNLPDASRGPPNLPGFPQPREVEEALRRALTASRGSVTAEGSVILSFSCFLSFFLSVKELCSYPDSPRLFS